MLAFFSSIGLSPVIGTKRKHLDAMRMRRGIRSVRHARRSADRATGGRLLDHARQFREVEIWQRALASREGGRVRRTNR